ncbi:zinc finger protein 62 homolog [Aedes albopictus]|uniref:Uncharacterized protein n=1 Tax=Aedes albopictus TaxID=7160 RepID=A0ABM1Z7L4_AEDAL
MFAVKEFIKIEVPTPPNTAPESYCQFCYATEDLIPVFPVTADNAPQQERIVDLVYQLVGIQLTDLDKFPSSICGGCLFKLEEFDHFRRKCLVYRDEILRASPSWEVPSSAVLYLKSESMEKSEASVNWSSDGNEGPTLPNEEREPVNSKIPRFSWQDKEPPNSKIPRFSWAKTGRTGPLMQKLNKLRGVKNKKPKRNLIEKKDYRCRACLRFFTDKDSINTHLRTHLDTVNVRCLNCSRGFDTVQGLMFHSMSEYILSSFTCQHCDVLFKSKEELVTHELYCELDHSKYETTEAPKAHQCPQCPKSYDKRHTLESHMLLHDPKLVCHECGTDFHSEYKLKNHYERYHSNGTAKLASVVKCQLCQRVFVDASAYRSHLTGFHQAEQSEQMRQLDDDDKLYECDHCGKRFWSINTIRYHVLVHRLYRDCDQCPEYFRSQQELRDHKLAAHPVKCPFCPKEFFAKKPCRSHATKKHGMVQIKLLAEDAGVTYEWRKLVFKCASCEQDYEFYRELKDHYGKMHPGARVLIKCSYCEKHISSSRIGYLSHVTGNCGQTPRKVKAWH